MKSLMRYVCGLIAAVACLGNSTGVSAQAGAGKLDAAKEPSATAKPEDTEQWQPVPVKVSPGASAGAAPSDAIVLFDGRNLDEWVMAKDRSPARWRIDNGMLVVDKTTGNIATKRLFKDYQLHLEWRIPADITGEGQARGNSGLYLASTGTGDKGYEIQILDSWENKTYVNGQAASVYKQSPPLVNASRKPGEWQAYDVVWTAPVFDPGGALEAPAYVTLFHNGVLVQNHFRLLGETLYIGKPAYHEYDRAPIELQAHGDPSAPISFRNIWVRELTEQRPDAGAPGESSAFPLTCASRPSKEGDAPRCADGK
jgi:hypothetical protein